MKLMTKDRKTLLYFLAAASPIAFAVWQTLLNNYVVEVAGFTGRDIGFLQSIREIPGFLAFTVVWVLLIVRQQRLAIVSLILLGLGTAATGVFSSILGLYVTTVLMSVGFHYLETMQTSLSLQWLTKDEAPRVLGKIIGVRSMATLVVLGGLYLGLQFFQPNYTWIYALGGGAVVCIGIYCWAAFPHFKDDVVQRKDLFLRKRYWLYYLLTFLAGARRQIFTVFASFLLVQKFGFPLEKMVLLILVNSAINIWFAPKIGALIGFIGERRALTLEYTGLIVIFLSYALVENGNLAIALYILDQLFFSMAIAIKTYFQKIADPADIAATAGISFTINHIAAVILPAALGLIWIFNHGAVFVVGAVIALGSLTLVQLIPDAPRSGREIRWPARGAGQAA